MSKRFRVLSMTTFVDLTEPRVPPKMLRDGRCCRFCVDDYFRRQRIFDCPTTDVGKLASAVDSDSDYFV